MLSPSGNYGICIFIQQHCPLEIGTTVPSCFVSKRRTFLPPSHLQFGFSVSVKSWGNNCLLVDNGDMLLFSPGNEINSPGVRPLQDSLNCDIADSAF